MRISGESVRLRTISREVAPAGDFVRYLQTRLGCRKYNPVPELEEALARYGHIEIYTCPTAARLLDNSTLTRTFIQNQINGLSFNDNVKAVFARHRIRVLIHEDGPLCLLHERRYQSQISTATGTGDFKRTGRKAILRVMQEEIKHAPPPPHWMSRNWAPLTQVGPRNF